MKDKNKGFTLIELLITLAIASIVMAAVWQSFQSQQESYVAQEQVSAMQQNLRGGLEIMVREVRMAGLDMSGDADAGFVVATGNDVQFTMDMDNSGTVNAAAPADPNEDIHYVLYQNLATTKQYLIRLTNGAPIPLSTANIDIIPIVAEDIEAIEFVYTFEDGTQTLAPAAVDFELIRSIDISILARTGKRDKNFINAETYNPASVLYGIAAAAAWGPFNDGFKRRILITSVRCRNMGVIN